MNKNITQFIVICATMALAGCGGVMVSLGLSDPPPVVTNSEYFNNQVDMLLDRLKANQSRGARKAAVLDFVNADGQVSAMGKYLTTKFSERALTKSMFRVTPPGQVREILDKLKITKTGVLTQTQVEAIGKALGVDAVVTGVVSDLQKGSDIDLTVKSIQSATGDLLSAASVNIDRSKQVQALLKQVQ